MAKILFLRRRLSDLWKQPGWFEIQAASIRIHSFGDFMLAENQIYAGNTYIMASK